VPAIPSTWLVGSIEGLALQEITVDGGNVDAVNPGNWYLYHATPALSLMRQLQDAIAAETGAAAIVTMGEDRIVRIQSAGGNFTLSWGGAPDLPGLLGFSGALLSGDSLYTADGISPLLFSPGWPATMPVGEGQSGYPVEDEHTQISADGSIVDSEWHNVQTHNEFAWQHVTAARVRASDSTSTLDQGGTWHRFRELVLRPNYRWQAYETVIEDAASTDAVTWPSALGTYKRRALPSGKFDRNIRNANTRWGIEVEAIAQTEYPANA
jgi:hypothetical protein